MKQIAWLDPSELGFPQLEDALHDPNGLLAAGGDLSPERLLLAYRSGIFPWYEEGQPILWWSPDPRCVLFPVDIRISRSLRKKLQSNRFEVRLNTSFDDVLHHCAMPRRDSAGTWITGEMQRAYERLHQLGYAHSIEVFEDDEMVGGLYGVSTGRMFFGESMFHEVTDASKIALAHLCRLMIRLECPLIDCQVENDHLLSLGATALSRAEFHRYVAHYGSDRVTPIDWRELPSVLPPW